MTYVVATRTSSAQPADVTALEICARAAAASTVPATRTSTTVIQGANTPSRTVWVASVMVRSRGASQVGSTTKPRVLCTSALVLAAPPSRRLPTPVTKPGPQLDPGTQPLS